MQANSGYEAALDPWTASLFDALQVLFPSRPPGRPAPRLRQCRFTATVSHPDTSAAKAPVEASLFQQACAASATFQELSATATGTRASALPGTPSPPPNGAPARPQRPCLRAPFWAAVSTSRRITAADHWQVVQHVEFDISAACMAYRPGDILSTLPHVPEATGRKFLERIGVATGALARRPAVLPLLFTAAAVLLCCVRQPLVAAHIAPPATPTHAMCRTARTPCGVLHAGRGRSRVITVHACRCDRHHRHQCGGAVGAAARAHARGGLRRERHHACAGRRVRRAGRGGGAAAAAAVPHARGPRHGAAGARAVGVLRHGGGARRPCNVLRTGAPLPPRGRPRPPLLPQCLPLRHVADCRPPVHARQLRGCSQDISAGVSVPHRQLRPRACGRCQQRHL